MNHPIRYHKRRSFKIAMALPTTLTVSILSLLLLLLLLLSPSNANENNVLVTGETLLNTGRLIYAGNTLIMQNDCNLVLYSRVPGHGFQSNTARRGINCTLTLSNLGQLIITSGNGIRVWSSPSNLAQGNYAAVLGPNGVLNIFGPSVWSIPDSSSTSDNSALGLQLKNIPFVRNLLFSSQVLYGDGVLISGDYTLALTESCNLEFRKATTEVVWESNTSGRGKDCFLRLNGVGDLSIVNDNYVVLWSTPRRPAAQRGNYVFIIGIQGQAIIYGPVVWSAGTPNSGYLAQLHGADR